MSTGGSNPPHDRIPANPPPLGLVGSVLLFGGAGLLLLGATHGLIPRLGAATGVEPVLLWFAVSGLGVFLPLLLAAIVLLRQEATWNRPDLWRGRLRFRAMNAADWLWSLGGLFVIGILAVSCLAALKQIIGDVRLHPAFLRMEPLSEDRYWILAVWFPFWLLNIFSEEILWRGVLLPRQEASFGRLAWLVNGAFWLLFHIPFGPQILLTLAPTTLILPYVVQRRQNSWTGVVIHAGLNGPGFIAVAFGFA